MVHGLRDSNMHSGVLRNIKQLKHEVPIAEHMKTIQRRSRRSVRLQS